MPQNETIRVYPPTHHGSLIDIGATAGNTRCIASRESYEHGTGILA